MSDLIDNNEDPNISCEEPSPETLQDSSTQEIKEYSHDWYDPEVIWKTTYSKSIMVSNFALRYICKHCLIEMIGIMGNSEFHKKLEEKSCIE